MRVIAITNHKGGVGKTTTVVNLGAGLLMLKKKVLLIDLDPQAHLTYSLGIQAHELHKTIYELLKGEFNFNDVMIKRGELNLLPSSLDLSGADVEFSDMPGRERLRVGRLLKCPPFSGIWPRWLPG